MYSNGRLLLLFACDRTSNLPATRSPERLTAAALVFFTLYLFATEPDNFGHCNPVPFAAKIYLTRSLSGSHTAIGTHSRFTRQFLGYAQRERLARTLFYDFPVTLTSDAWGTRKDHFLHGKGGFVLPGRAALVEAAPSDLMASHWPP